jgi:hypothetical protein
MDLPLKNSGVKQSGLLVKPNPLIIIPATASPSLISVILHRLLIFHL